MDRERAALEPNARQLWVWERCKNSPSGVSGGTPTANAFWTR